MRHPTEPPPPMPPRRGASGTTTSTTPYPRLDGIDVLLVEDDAAVLDAYAFAFTACGATVRPVDSARAAWDALRTRVPDVLVSDIAMPEEDGCALLQRIRASTEAPTLPAIALTGFARSDDEARIRAAGFAAIVTKPVDPEHLARTVLAVLGRGHFDNADPRR